MNKGRRKLAKEYATSSPSLENDEIKEFLERLDKVVKKLEEGPSIHSYIFKEEKENKLNLISAVMRDFLIRKNRFVPDHKICESISNILVEEKKITRKEMIKIYRRLRKKDEFDFKNKMPSIKNVSKYYSNKFSLSEKEIKEYLKKYHSNGTSMKGSLGAAFYELTDMTQSEAANVTGCSQLTIRTRIKNKGE